MSTKTSTQTPPAKSTQESTRPTTLSKLAAEDGQATAEYGLVMLAAAAIAGLLLAWATSTDAVGRIMEAVVASIIGDIG